MRVVSFKRNRQSTFHECRRPHADFPGFADADNGRIGTGPMEPVPELETLKQEFAARVKTADGPYQQRVLDGADGVYNGIGNCRAADRLESRPIVVSSCQGFRVALSR